MAPKLAAIGFFIQLRNTHAVLVRCNMLSFNIHRDLAEIEVCPDACCGRDARGFQHVLNDRHGKLSGGAAIGGKIIGYIHEYLVNGIDMDICGRNIVKVDVVYLCAALHIKRHLRRRNEIVQRQRRIGFHIRIMA
ncbi:hypothetical protein SDC9_139304 [bioreactor metagenome]|uniref:Uncharacterized protein n=1 Tax=bioreactor metagenome TaxID=1076179 RepID=A0A645DSB7_9ZZZZ